MILTVTLNPAIDKVYEVTSFAVGKVFRPSNMWVTAGGKGLNVSRVATILGAQVVATGFLGGSNGQFIRAQISKQGIKDAFVEVEGETRICIAINDPILNTSTEVLEPGPTISAAEQEKFLQGFRDLAAQVDIVTISGSLPKGVSTDFYGKLVEICHSLNKRVLLDTSGIALTASLVAHPFMIKPNASELEAIVGKELVTESDVLQAAQELHQRGVDIVCVTLGGDGCIAVTNDDVYRLTAPTIEIVSAVGSGDSFVAGCAVAFTQGQDLVEVLKMGMACGMANTQFAQTGYVTAELVEQFKQQVVVQRY